MAKASAKKKPAKQAKAQPKKKAKPMAKKPAKRTVVKAAAKAAKKKPVLKKPVPAPKKAVKPVAAKPAPIKAATKAATKAAFAPKPLPKGKGKPIITKAATLTSGGNLPPKRTKRPYKAVKLPAGYKPTDKEEYMNPQQLEYFRQKLLTWRKELIEESRETLDHLHEEDWHQADIADRASLETEAGVELRTRNRYLKLISKIDAALRRIEEGEYGYCEETGDPIGLKRLEARPVATLSIEAQERHEREERQVADEE